MNMQVLKNEAQNGLELYFDTKPEQQVIEALKTNGFRWHNVKKCWFAKASEEKQKLIEAITKGEATTTAAETKEKVNKYGVKVGDVFMFSFGYDATLYEYFQVVEICSDCNIKVRQIAASHGDAPDYDSLSWSEKVEQNAFLTWSQFINQDNSPTLKRVSICAYNNLPKLSFTNGHYHAFKLNEAQIQATRIGDNYH
jgi:hypothetical protein